MIKSGMIGSMHIFGKNFHAGEQYVFTQGMKRAAGCYVGEQSIKSITILSGSCNWSNSENPDLVSSYIGSCDIINDGVVNPGDTKVTFTSDGYIICISKLVSNEDQIPVYDIVQVDSEYVIPETSIGAVVLCGYVESNSQFYTMCDKLNTGDIIVPHTGKNPVKVCVVYND